MRTGSPVGGVCNGRAASRNQREPRRRQPLHSWEELDYEGRQGWDIGAGIIKAQDTAASMRIWVQEAIEDSEDDPDGLKDSGLGPDATQWSERTLDAPEEYHDSPHSDAVSDLNPNSEGSLSTLLAAEDLHLGWHIDNTFCPVEIRSQHRRGSPSSRPAAKSPGGDEKHTEQTLRGQSIETGSEHAVITDTHIDHSRKAQGGHCLDTHCLLTEAHNVDLGIAGSGVVTPAAKSGEKQEAVSTSPVPLSHTRYSCTPEFHRIEDTSKVRQLIAEPLRCLSENLEADSRTATGRSSSKKDKVDNAEEPSFPFPCGLSKPKEVLKDCLLLSDRKCEVISSDICALPDSFKLIPKLPFGKESPELINSLCKKRDNVCNASVIRKKNVGDTSSASETETEDCEISPTEQHDSTKAAGPLPCRPKAILVEIGDDLHVNCKKSGQTKSNQKCKKGKRYTDPLVNSKHLTELNCLRHTDHIQGDLGTSELEDIPVRTIEITLGNHAFDKCMRSHFDHIDLNGVSEEVPYENSTSSSELHSDTNNNVKASSDLSATDHFTHKVLDEGQSWTYEPVHSFTEEVGRCLTDDTEAHSPLRELTLGLRPLLQIPNKDHDLSNETTNTDVLCTLRDGPSWNCKESGLIASGLEGVSCEIEHFVVEEQGLKADTDCAASQEPTSRTCCADSSDTTERSGKTSGLHEWDSPSVQEKQDLESSPDERLESLFQFQDNVALQQYAYQDVSLNLASVNNLEPILESDRSQDNSFIVEEEYGVEEEEEGKASTEPAVQDKGHHLKSMREDSSSTDSETPLGSCTLDSNDPRVIQSLPNEVVCSERQCSSMEVPQDLDTTSTNSEETDDNVCSHLGSNTSLHKAVKNKPTKGSSGGKSSKFSVFSKIPSFRKGKNLGRENKNGNLGVSSLECPEGERDKDSGEGGQVHRTPSPVHRSHLSHSAEQLTELERKAENLDDDVFNKGEIFEQAVQKDSASNPKAQENVSYKRSKSTDSLNLRMRFAQAHKSLSSFFESRTLEKDSEGQDKDSEESRTKQSRRRLKQFKETEVLKRTVSVPEADSNKISLEIHSEYNLHSGGDQLSLSGSPSSQTASCHTNPLSKKRSAQELSPENEESVDRRRSPPDGLTILSPDSNQPSLDDSKVTPVEGSTPLLSLSSSPPLPMSNQVTPTKPRSSADGLESPSRPLSPKPHSPRFGTHRRSFRYSYSRANTFSHMLPGQVVSAEAVADPPERPKTHKPRMSPLMSMNFSDMDCQHEDSGVDIQPQVSLFTSMSVNEFEQMPEGTMRSQGLVSVPRRKSQQQIVGKPRPNKTYQRTALHVAPTTAKIGSGVRRCQLCCVDDLWIEEAKNHERRLAREVQGASRRPDKQLQDTRARLSLTVMESFSSLPLKGHCFSQSTPVGLDCLGWQQNASYTVSSLEAEQQTAVPGVEQQCALQDSVSGSMRTQSNERVVPLPGGSRGSGSSGLSPGSDSDSSPGAGFEGGTGSSLRGVLSHYWSLESLHSTTAMVIPDGTTDKISLGDEVGSDEDLYEELQGSGHRFGHPGGGGEQLAINERRGEGKSYVGLSGFGNYRQHHEQRSTGIGESRDTASGETRERGRASRQGDAEERRVQLLTHEERRRLEVGFGEGAQQR
ncbi:hypothetical protein Z043_106784 [Scleropages formosus]|uniref:Rho guanine nucleotide exchange factor 4 n=1 Tax=Scleropages formosus TaxID=113540 RepID=A0A0N8K167_SCLFO|nr:hypothetical protein Z043_106784 [Scleropages formosus]